MKNIVVIFIVGISIFLGVCSQFILYPDYPIHFNFNSNECSLPDYTQTFITRDGPITITGIINVETVKDKLEFNGESWDNLNYTKINFINKSCCCTDQLIIYE